MRMNLINARKNAKLTQEELAQFVHLSRSHYAQIETGAKNPSLRVALALKVALRETDDSIFDNDARIMAVRGRPCR